MPLPIPLEPPTISAVFPEKSKSFMGFACPSTDESGGAFEQDDGAAVQPLAKVARRLAGAGAGVGAFEQDAELVAGERQVPLGGGAISLRTGAVAFDQFGRRGKADPGLYRNR